MLAVDNKTSGYLNYPISDLFQEIAIPELQDFFYGAQMSDSDQKRLNLLKDKRKELQEQLNKIDNCINDSKKLNFKEGEVVYHKTHGVVLITEIVVNLQESFADSKEPYKFYYKGYSQIGQIVVKSEEVMPYTEASRLLYEKEKK